MAVANCHQCSAQVDVQAPRCPHCGALAPGQPRRRFGFEYRSPAEIASIPLVHIALGRDPQTGKVRVARGIIAIGRIAYGVVAVGQLAIGVVSLGQLAVGAAFAIGQGAVSANALGQLSVGAALAIGQLACGWTVVAQIGLGVYVLAQYGVGQYLWTATVRDPVAVTHFEPLIQMVRGWIGM